MRQILTMLTFASVLGCQNSSKPEVIEIVHYNIIVAPDLSSRVNHSLYPKPLKDGEIVASLLRLMPTIAKLLRSENQKDKIQVSLINKSLLNQYNIDASRLVVDLGVFGTRQKDRIEYLTGNTTGSTYDQDAAGFLSEYTRLCEQAEQDHHGADIWTYMHSGLDKLVVNTASETTKFMSTTYVNKFRNILIILTDGYIESGVYKESGCPDSPNQCYYLSGSRIKEFRKAFLESKSGDLTEFFRKAQTCIIPVANPVMSHVEVLVLEMYDRSLTEAGAASVYPTDMDIMKLFWTDWLNRSGVTHAELHSTLTTTADVERVVLGFIQR
jgi:hypothetical protein